MRARVCVCCRDNDQFFWHFYIIFNENKTNDNINQHAKYENTKWIAQLLQPDTNSPQNSSSNSETCPLSPWYIS